MLQSGQDLFVSFAGASKLRVLHPARVAARCDDVLILRYADPEALPTEQGRTVTVYFDGPAEFMQQPGERVEGEHLEGMGSTEWPEHGGAIRLLGEPVSAESRKCFRVGTVLAGYTANFGGLGECKLVDVSAAGVGFLSSERLSLGDSVDIELRLAGKDARGTGFIQSVKEVREGYRYGLLCLEDKGNGGLGRGLQQLTMDAQRTQLRRLAGAA